ncbi:hypothetical protein JQS43_11820 [Natronosporangium hydrolyticum]|uniref:EAL domain-containing protein n=1 Tax=Natronosporangium hydrolyticum TaxID=2811111 RepID=A0A895YS24_9ACTN|nr:hypothetical protein [Natronosporangium hydrolyticum]QSB16900.1 hypothetical protein JQS43_11820 [Natronosporangium hydrolyticum]
MGTSTLGFVETVRTLDQIGNYPSVMADLVAGFTEILVTEEVRDAAHALGMPVAAPGASTHG